MMQEAVLRTIIDHNVYSSTGYMGGELTEQRRKAFEYYLGEPFGNEQEGYSEVVSMDVQDVIESTMPDMMEIFGAGDFIGTFKPVGPEDEAFAMQATEYINYVVMEDNNGFVVLHDALKDALLQKTGIIKAWYDDAPVINSREKSSINTLELAELMSDDDVEILEIDEIVDGRDDLTLTPDGVLYDIRYRHSDSSGRIQLDVIPPEDFLITRWATDLETAEFTCHRVEKTVSELIADGYDRDTVLAIPSDDEQIFNEEKFARYVTDEEWPGDDESIDQMMRKVWLYECYIRVDYDEDDYAEMRQVVCAGAGYTILSNEEIDEHPFQILTPIRMPHKVFGRAQADLVMDIQLLKSTVWRQLVDNMVRVNNARTIIWDGFVNLDDMLVMRPGGVVRAKGNPNELVSPLTTQSLGPYAYPLLEYCDTVRETRTGVSRYNQGLDATTLNDTAAGISMILGRAQQRKLLMARVFAECGFKPLWKKLLRLSINHQNKSRVIRLRNKWTQIDPREWNATMDVKINVGLGHGTQESRQAAVGAIQEMQQIIINAQGGRPGGMVTEQVIYNAAVERIHTLGYRNHEQFIADPSESPAPEQGPDAATMKVQMEMQLAEQEMTLENERKRMQMFLDHQHKMEELGMRDARERTAQDFRAASQVTQLELKRDMAAAETAIKEQAANQAAGIA